MMRIVYDDQPQAPEAALSMGLPTGASGQSRFVYDDAAPQPPAPVKVPPAASGPLSEPSPSLLDSALSPLRALGGLVAPIARKLQGAAEIGAAGLTGAIATPVAGLAALPAGPAELLQGRDPIAAQADIAEQLRHDLTYQPGPAAGELLAPVAPTLRKIGQVARSGLESLSPETQNVVENVALPAADVAANLLPAARGVGPLARGLEGAGEAAARQTLLPPSAVARSDAVQTARRMGLKLRHEDVQAVMPGERVPGEAAGRLAPPGDVKSRFTLDNQAVITREAGAELGLKDAKTLDDATFNKLKAPEHAIYESAEQAAMRVQPSMELQGALQDGIKLAKFKTGENVGVTKTLSALRRNAAKHIKGTDVATQEMGYAERAAADRLEEAFGKQLEATGNGPLFKQFQEARQRLAKINDVETATRAGQVDASVIYRLGQKGKPLTGRLKMIADVNEHFPNITRHSLKTASGAPTGGEPTKYGLIRSATGAVARNVPGLRSRLNVYSDAYQSRFGPAASDVERSYFGSYGAPEAPLSPPFKGKNPDVIEPDASLSSSLGVGGPVPQAPRDLVAESPRAYAQLPEAPSRLSAETPPPVRGDVNFRASQPSGLGDELSLAPSEPRRMGPVDYKAPSLADQLVGDQQLARTEHTRQGELPVTTDQPSKYQLETTGRTKPSVNPDEEAIIPGSTVLRINEGERTVGYIALKENEDGALQISRSKVADELQGKKGEGDPRYGQGLIMKALDHAEQVNKPLVSDKTVTVAQLRAYDALVRKGKIQVQYSDPAAVEAALKKGDPRTVVKGKGGQPVITAIGRASKAREPVPAVEPSAAASSPSAPLGEALAPVGGAEGTALDRAAALAERFNAQRAAGDTQGALETLDAIRRLGPRQQAQIAARRRETIKPVTSGE